MQSGWLLSSALILSACGDGETGQRGAGGHGQDAGDRRGTGATAGPASDSGGARNDSASDSAADAGLGETGGSDAGDAAQTDGGRPPGTGLRVVDCPVPPLAAAQQGVCEVSVTGSRGLLLRGTVLAPNRVLRRGTVFVRADGVIGCVGCDCSQSPGASDAWVVSCENGVISPGLINSHDHITFAGTGPVAHGNERYAHRHDWRLGLRGHTELDVPGRASRAEVLAAELRFVMSGATSTVSAGGEPGLLRNLDVAALSEGLPVEPVETDTFPLDDAAGILLTSGCSYGASPTTGAAIQGFNAYAPHIAEGIDLAARNELICTSTGALNLIQPKTAIVHAMAASAGEALRIRRERAWVVWSPRSNLDLYGNTAPVSLLDHAGVGIALGTDWLASGSMNMSRELFCADALNARQFSGHFSDFDLFRMVTTNAAFAAGVERGLGLLKAGSLADISVFDGSLHKDHRAVVSAGAAEVVLVLRGGKALYGDDTLLSTPALGGASCETLSVCGRSKRACVASDTGVALATVISAADAVLPLFSCGAPSPEPSCVPLRPGEYGETTLANDRDGDGIADAVDRCPEIFDPIRPMDSRSQADSDNDGRGDACDPCPDSASGACPAPDADDLDDDAWPNGEDVCPENPDPAQQDADRDGHGDACDFCAAPNPGLEPCPLPIEAIRERSHPAHPPLGALVRIHDAWVTALRPNTGNSRGFYVQGAARAAFTGIFVFTGSRPPGVAVGNRVSLSGRYEEFFGLSELSEPSVSILDPGTALPFAPLDVAPAEIATGGQLAEAYESMLLRVLMVSVSNVNPDAPRDFDELAVSGNLRIDDLIYPALDNTFTMSTLFSSITGVLGYSFANSKLMPRDAADLVP